MNIRTTLAALACFALPRSSLAFATPAPPIDGLRWTAQELPVLEGVSSLVATGATKDGVIIAQGVKDGVITAFVFMPMAALGLVEGWNELGAAHSREMPSTALAASGTVGASVSPRDGQLEFTLAIAEGFDECGVGVSEFVVDHWSGWVTAVTESGHATGALIGATEAGDTRLTPYRASVTNGMQLLSSPAGLHNAVPLDQCETGWIVGTAHTATGWRGVVCSRAAFISMDGRIRNQPDAVIDSCVAVTDNLTVIANIESAPGEFHPVVLHDARADYVATEIVDLEDLVAYAIDYSDTRARADIDASGAVSEDDLLTFIDLWITAQSGEQTPPTALDPLSIYSLAIRGGASEHLPLALREAARTHFESVIAQLADPPEPAPDPPVVGPCDHQPFVERSAGGPDYCGSVDVDVPEFIPKCCAEHDNCYRGFTPGGERLVAGQPPPGGRKGCDELYLTCMNIECDKDHDCPFKEFGCNLLAFGYFLGVRAFGNSAFCECRQFTDPEDCGPPPLQEHTGALESVVLP